MCRFYFLFVCFFAFNANRETAGHGFMVKPLTWFEYKQYLSYNGSIVFDYVGMKSSMQCRAGCRTPKSLICNEKYSCEGYPGHPGCGCMWYTNNTMIQQPTLFDPELLTYPRAEQPERKLHHPWRAPGSAPIDSPCGVAGGNYHGCEGGKCNIHKGGFGFGPRAEDVEFPYDFHVTQWKRGTVVEVAWGIVANHGGGYSYRLCKTSGNSKVTEKCFQELPLQFVGDKQWVQFGEDETTRIEIAAIRTSEGTFPEGSQWTKNPIPACIGGLGGFYYPTPDCPKGVQFTPPRADLYGFGVNSVHSYPLFSFSIVDRVLIPEDLPPGDYVLSFRWDVEQTPQVWNSCSSINIS